MLQFSGFYRTHSAEPAVQGLGKPAGTRNVPMSEMRGLLFDCCSGLEFQHIGVSFGPFDFWRLYCGPILLEVSSRILGRHGGRKYFCIRHPTSQHDRAQHHKKRKQCSCLVVTWLE